VFIGYDDSEGGSQLIMILNNNALRGVELCLMLFTLHYSLIVMCPHLFPLSPHIKNNLLLELYISQCFRYIYLTYEGLQRKHRKHIDQGSSRVTDQSTAAVIETWHPIFTNPIQSKSKIIKSETRTRNIQIIANQIRI
jgi:hypothetical protein